MMVSLRSAFYGSHSKLDLSAIILLRNSNEICPAICSIWSEVYASYELQKKPTAVFWFIRLHNRPTLEEPKLDCIIPGPVELSAGRQ